MNLPDKYHVGSRLRCSGVPDGAAGCMVARIHLRKRGGLVYLRQRGGLLRRPNLSRVGDPSPSSGLAPTQTSRSDSEFQNTHLWQFEFEPSTDGK